MGPKREKPDTENPVDQALAAPFTPEQYSIVKSLPHDAIFTTFFFAELALENKVTLEELDQKLPNSFHDAKIFSIKLDYVPE